MFGLSGWKSVEMKGIEFELNCMVVEKWKGKGYGVVIERERGIDGEVEIWEGEYR